ncbi:phage portal protein [Devosia sp. YIM 151766]|uniref:phage portal protein n=1 Tax=Devosia sp. YIM 151766 TaxID=3017325 RepID=UPI00255C73AF|nr:phage portal protein [Devosia sp. YIM 151766]WIY52453.1 phage portal protein [Devosia sp. YIM 151766]
MAKTAQPQGVRWGLMDRALATVAPRAAAKRYAARVSIANMRRGYEGAQKGRHTDGWRTANTAADTEIGAAGSLLRDRMRDLVRNNALAAQAVQVLVNNLVGYGIRPRAASGNKTLNKKVDKLFEQWSKRADAHGHTDFYGLQVLAVREMLEGGDLFALKRPLRRDEAKGGVPMQVELREADHLDTSKFLEEVGGRRIKQGIEYDRSGRRQAYWMYPDHPGDVSLAFSRRLDSVRLPSDMVAHLFERQRVQSRGVPWGTPALTALRDLGDWQVAEMVRKKTESCMVGIVFGDDQELSATPTIKDDQGRTIEQFEPGLIAYASGGKDIKFNQPAATPGIREWNLVQMHIIAAGFRVPYVLMTGDLSQANFSSSRVGLNEFRRMIEQVQWQIVIPMLCERIWDWFIDAAYTAGLISSADVPAEWAPPRFESVNPLQDAQTDLLEVRAGFASTPQMIGKRGYDPLEVLGEQAQFVEEADRLGLVFDSDPRKVTNAGLAQAKDPLDVDADPANPPPGHEKA